MKGEARKPPVYTIGHSTRRIDEFVRLLQAADVALVIDVRSIRGSRTNPQYNAETLPESLAEFGIGYAPISELGGRRSRQKSVPAEVNAYWQNRSFHNYADFAMSAEFAIGLQRLLKLSADAVCAVMCAEAVWWRCHRSLIADYLKALGVTVTHILGEEKSEAHPYTSAAQIVNGKLSYRGILERRE